MPIPSLVLALHPSPQFFLFDVVDVREALGGKPAARSALGGDLIEQSVLRLGG